MLAGTLPDGIKQIPYSYRAYMRVYTQQGNWCDYYHEGPITGHEGIPVDELLLAFEAQINLQ